MLNFDLRKIKFVPVIFNNGVYVLTKNIKN